MTRPLQQPGNQRASAAAKRDTFRFGGQHILELLNSKPDSAAERVTWIVEAFHRIIRLHESIMLPSGFGPGKRALIAEVAGIIKELNARLSRFKSFPSVFPLLQAERCLAVQYQLALAKEMTRQTQTEGLAAMWLLGHIDTVHLFRRCYCLQCRKWFFAVKDHQKYCSETCRKREAAQGESFKEKRRRYMKKYRCSEAERDARAKLQVGFSKKSKKGGK